MRKGGEIIESGRFVVVNLTVEDVALSNRLAESKVDALITIPVWFKERRETEKNKNNNITQCNSANRLLDNTINEAGAAQIAKLLFIFSKSNIS